MVRSRMKKVFAIGIILTLMMTMIVITVPKDVSAGPYPGGPPFPDQEVDDNRPPGWYGGNHYLTITAAINAASSGDWIYVWKGTYNERFTLNKKLKLEGEDKTQTTIQGGSGGDVVTISADDVTVKDFTVSTSGSNSGIVLKGIVTNKVTDCLITDITVNTINQGFGLEYSDSNVIINNTCSNAIIGLFITDDSDSNTIINNTFLNNNWGMWVQEANYNTISDNNCSNNNYDGIFISGVIPSSDNNIISNNILNSNIRGINNAGNSNIIINNKLSNNEVGIKFHWSKNNIVYNNSMVLNGIYIIADSIEYWNTHTITTNNTVNGKSVYYWKNQTSGVIPSGAGEVILANCTNVKVTGQNLNSGTVGILIGYTDYTLMDNNTCNSNNYFGICLYEDNNFNILYNNTINLNDEHGIILSNNNECNIITNNTLNKNNDGIHLKNSVSNILKNNNLNSNTNFGIDILNSDDNLIYHNNFIENNYNETEQSYDGPQASDNGGNNFWDNGYPVGGNYWADFETAVGTPYDDYRGMDQDSAYGYIGDGIVDQGSGSSGGLNQYYILGGPPDTYPLLLPMIDDRVQRPPIRINSYQDFDEEHGVIDGTGIQLDPYIIEGWHINGSGFGNCIYIGNTTDHFIIRDCYVFNASGGTWCPWYQNAGITLYHVQNGIITSFDWNIGDPYDISTSYIISKPTISTLNNVDGIMLHGDWLNGSATCFNTISNSIISNNGETGIMLNQDVHHNTISNNIIFNNEYGIRNLFAAYGNTIIENNIKNNDYYGIKIEDNTSNNNDVYQNNFIDNNLLYGVGVQAYDDGLIQGQNDNRWDNIDSYGNYWSDYESRYPYANNDGDVWDTVYEIDPILAGHQDRYPLVNPVS